MSAAKQSFLSEHWDWLVAAAGIAAAAAAGAMLVMSLGDTPEAGREECEMHLRSIKPSHEGVPEVEIDSLQKAFRLIKDPPSLRAVDSKKANFLASEGRVFCKQGDDDPKAKKGCGKPIPTESETCPFCGVKQSVVKVEADADHDGLPNDWETKFGLNPNDPSDAAKDVDGDGFTNLEEFTANTDPKDKASHPDYLDSLSIASQLKHTTLPFYFNAYNPIRNGYRFTFQRIGKKGYDSKFTATSGEEIGSADGKTKTGWKVGEFVKKTEMRTLPGSKDPNLKRPVDVSTLTLTRVKDGRSLKVVIDERDIAVEKEIELSYSRGAGRKFTAHEGFEFELNGRRYRVLKLIPAEGSCSVTILDVDANKEKTIR